MLTNPFLNSLVSKTNKVFFEKDHDIRADVNPVSRAFALSLNANLMVMGYTLSLQVIDKISKLEPEDAKNISVQIENAVKSKLGADVVYEPMYPNFPAQVINASDIELYFNAIVHYFTLGQWKPVYEKKQRKLFNYDNVKFTEIDLLKDEDFIALLTNMLGSNDKLPQEDLDIINYVWDSKHWFLNNVKVQLQVKGIEIPNKELLATLVAKDINIGSLGLAKTATDILRICTVYSGGPADLSENVKFKSMKRFMRKEIVQRLEKVINVDDINLNRSKWVKLFHNLHVGDFSDKVYNIAKTFRNNLPVETMVGKIDKLYNDGHYLSAAVQMKSRPGYFARNLDSLIRNAHPEDVSNIIHFFFKEDVVSKVSTRVLIQLYNHFTIRKRGKVYIDTSSGPCKIVITKSGKTRIYEADETKLEPKLIDVICTKLVNELIRRFEDRESNNKVYIKEGLKGAKVYINPNLKKIKVPIGASNTPRGLGNFAVGTEMKMPKENTLRFFIYWEGQDIDLSCMLLDANYSPITQVSWTNLRTSGMTHSGDITSAPKGASEFIDVDLMKIKKTFPNARYIVPSVYVYRGPTFDKHTKCYFGWMGREKPKSGEIYEPASVKVKVEIDKEAKRAMPVAFDLKNDTVIIMNAVSTNMRSGGIMIDENEQVKNYVQYAMNKKLNMSLYDLFKFASTNNEIVKNKKDADFVYGVKEGDITAFDYNLITSEYLK